MLPTEISLGDKAKRWTSPRTFYCPEISYHIRTFYCHPISILVHRLYLLVVLIPNSLFGYVTYSTLATPSEFQPMKTPLPVVHIWHTCIAENMYFWNANRAMWYYSLHDISAISWLPHCCSYKIVQPGTSGLDLFRCNFVQLLQAYRQRFRVDLACNQQFFRRYGQTTLQAGRYS